jgi:hypothetical protein
MDKESELACLVYVSQDIQHLGEAEIAQLLPRWSEKNDRLHVTGLLIRDEDSFLQVLEGEKKVIDDLFQTISRDSRHAKITKLVETPIKERSFSDWSMKYATVAHGNSGVLPELMDYLGNKLPLERVASGGIKKLLDDFLEGKWHLRAVEVITID